MSELAGGRICGDSRPARLRTTWTWRPVSWNSHSRPPTWRSRTRSGRPRRSSPGRARRLRRSSRRPRRAPSILSPGSHARGRPGLPPWRASTASRAAKLSRSRCYWPVDGHVREVDHGMPPVVALANRLPVQRSNGGWQLSPGGLVTALRPVMTSRSGAWVGWDGGTKGIPRTLPDFSAQLRPVGLSASQVRNYYYGFANATLWPLLHDAIERPRFERSWWDSYRQVNVAFADAALAELGSSPSALALAWVHDYHLMLVPDLIRQRRASQPVGFFLH